MTKITNTSDGPRSVHSVNGEVLIEAGATADLDLSDSEMKSAKATGYFEFGAAAAAKAAKADDTE